MIVITLFELTRTRFSTTMNLMIVLFHSDQLSCLDRCLTPLTHQRRVFNLANYKISASSSLSEYRRVIFDHTDLPSKYDDPNQHMTYRECDNPRTEKGIPQPLAVSLSPNGPRNVSVHVCRVILSFPLLCNVI